MGKIKRGELTEAAQQRMAKTLIESVAEIGMLRAKYMEQTLGDRELGAKLKKLADDYAAALRPKSAGG